MDKQTIVEAVAGECIVPLEVAERALERCNGNAHDAIFHLTVQSDSDWRRRLYGD